MHYICSRCASDCSGCTWPCTSLIIDWFGLVSLYMPFNFLLCTVCVPGCGRCSCSWSGCGCHCSSCYNRFTDPVCLAANAACEALKAPIIVSLRVSRESVSVLGDSLNVAKGVFSAAESALEAASQELQDASDGLEVVNFCIAEVLRYLFEQ